jgi:hypothetical protein
LPGYKFARQVKNTAAKEAASFSGLDTMVRIILMYYVDFYIFFNHPEKDWEKLLEVAHPPQEEPSLFD